MVFPFKCLPENIRRQFVWIVHRWKWIRVDCVDVPAADRSPNCPCTKREPFFVFSAVCFCWLLLLYELKTRTISEIDEIRNSLRGNRQFYVFTLTDFFSIDFIIMCMVRCAVRLSIKHKIICNFYVSHMSIGVDIWYGTLPVCERNTERKLVWLYERDELDGERLEMISKSSIRCF